MAQATRQAHFFLSPELYERAQKAAEADRRSLSNWLTVTVERALKDVETSEPAGQSAPAA